MRTEKEQKGNLDKLLNKETNKPIKKDAPLILPFSSKEFEEVWNKWVEYRKEIKKPMKDTTVNLQLKKLEKWGEANAILALSNSMESGYTGIFEPKATLANNATVQASKQKEKYKYFISGRKHEHSDDKRFNMHKSAFENHIQIERS